MPLPTIRAVLCDMDGLLLDSEHLSMQALVDAGAALGADLPMAFCTTLIGCPMDTCAAMIRARQGDDFPIDRLVTLHETFLTGFIADGRLTTRPGVAALLDTLDRLALPRAVVTSSSRSRATLHLQDVELLDRFAHLITRDDVSRGKPDPEPYLLAARRLGIPPSDCLALEDSYNGTRSAHAAGIPVIMIPDLLPPTPEMREIAWKILPSLHSVVELLTNPEQILFF